MSKIQIVFHNENIEKPGKICASNLKEKWDTTFDWRFYSYPVHLLFLILKIVPKNILHEQCVAILHASSIHY